MNLKQIIGLCIAVSFVVSLGVVYFTKSESITQRGDRGERGERGESGGGDRDLGATPGTVVSSNFFEIGGVEGYYERQAMNATSSTLCSIQNKLNATSTIETFAATFTRGVLDTGLVNTVDISTTTSDFRFGSSTPALIYGHPLLLRASSSIVWKPNGATTTTAVTNAGAPLPFRGVLAGIRNTGASNFIIGPFEYLTLRVATGTPGILADPFQGTCITQFKKI